ncbi:hypothetical protein tb265_28960 [Gemmatimonadetes bacterium T265]|nr:hypothetical protein tb265_28960 [Gemmatimonadetes bacterium T265]
MRAAFRTFFIAGALAAGVGRTLAAQRYTRPDRPWTTFETAHFRLHAPAELADWARYLAARMESVRTAELRTVGTVPSQVTDVVVDDPINSANGSAYPYLDGPAVFLWPVPPDPRSYIGNARSWGELLAVHEFAHIAHLTRPSRNARQRLLRALLPGRIGPVSTRTSRWVWEGYATYVEGVLTGSGRPHAPLRAAVLRRWALDGALPTYTGMSATGGFLGGSFAYVMGSAYFEWLGATRGDSSLTAVWRRVSARVNRPFDVAFAGVYGDGPATLYDRFVAELTVAAAAERARLDSAGRVEGTLVQRLSRSTGDPAVSPDGRHVAIELASADGPSRLVVWRAGPGASHDTVVDSAEARARRRLLERDPEDVPAVRAYPSPRRPVATLLAVNGRGHHDPRWFADGRRVLVWRSELTADDVMRPDLFIWDTHTGGLRRVTRGAAVRDADPSPDGRRAAAARCAAGRCDLVDVDLASGAVRTVVSGTFTRTWTRPRWSPDGRRLVAPVQDGGRWRLALVDGATGAYTFATPNDGAERYDAVFTPDGGALVYTSERGGVPNVVRLALGDSTERALTRVLGAAFAPAPSAAERSVYYLDLTPHGLDLRRVAPDATPVPGDVVDFSAPPALVPRSPAAAVQSAVGSRPPVAVDTFATGPVRAHAYGAGPRRYVGLPFGSGTPDGLAGGLQLASLDPAGRLTWLLQGVASDPRPWHGASLRATWRGTRPAITGELFTATQALSDRSRLAGFGPDDPALAVRTRYTAAALFAGGDGWLNATLGGGRTPDVRLTGRAGVVAGRLRQDNAGAGAATAATGRRLALAEGGLSAGGARGDRGLYASLGAQVASGHTGGANWRRGMLTGAIGAYDDRFGVRLDGAYAAADRGAPAYERPAVGGAAPGLFDPGVVSQRLAFPALPTAYRAGRSAALSRLTLTGALLTPYAAAAGAGDRPGGWTRVVGVETRAVTPFAPFARAPQSRLVGGVARIFDGPLRDRTRGYVSAVFVP